MDAFAECEKFAAGTWCILLQSDFEHKHFYEMEGVYVIWYGDPNPLPYELAMAILGTT